MSTLLLLLTHVSAIGMDQGTFEQAYQKSLTSGRPLVVLIGATWCPACQIMKNTTLPQVAKAGGLDNVVFFYLDFDRQRQLATRLRRTTAIPQLIRFDRTSDGWKPQYLIGAKSVQQVYHFVTAKIVDAAAVRETSVENQPPTRDTNTVSETSSPPEVTAPQSQGPYLEIPEQVPPFPLPRKRNGLAHYWGMLQQILSQNAESSTAVQPVVAKRQSSALQ